MKPYNIQHVSLLDFSSIQFELYVPNTIEDSTVQLQVKNMPSEGFRQTISY